MIENRSNTITRRDLLLSVGMATAVGAMPPVGDSNVVSAAEPSQSSADSKSQTRVCGEYSDERLCRVAFPMGGMGAGMICLEGTGALSHFSLRNHPALFNEPCTFAAISVKGSSNIARVIEGPVPGWKRFGRQGAGFGEGD